LRFVDETSLTFEGFASGQAPITTETSEDTEPLNTFELGSSSIDLREGSLDLISGNFFTRTSELVPLLNRPCAGECAVQIWSQSPDKQWQLIQVSKGNIKEIGVWLVSQDDKIQLVPYVPPDSNWQWAEDNSLLWYLFYDREYGAYADAIHLRAPLSSNFYDKADGHPMNPTNYFMAFSPQNNALFSTKFIREGDNELQMLDLNSSPPNIISSQVITGLTTVSWNEATQSPLLQVAREDGLEFRDMAGTSVVIPLELIQKMYPSVTQDTNEIEEIFPKQNYVISPSGAHLAIAYPHGEIEVFSCK
jgi:hypothetical protein